jgi:hypothetical protein
MNSTKHKKNAGTFEDDKQIIETLRNQLMEKEKEMNALRQENEKLKLSVEFANQQIEMHQKNNEMLTSVIQNMSTKSVVYSESSSNVKGKSEKEPFNTKKYLNETCKNAHTIEDDLNSKYESMSFDDCMIMFNCNDHTISSISKVSNSAVFSDGFLNYWKKCVSNNQCERPVQTLDKHSNREHFSFKTKYILNDSDQLVLTNDAVWHDAYLGDSDDQGTKLFRFILGKFMTTLGAQFFKLRTKVRLSSDDELYNKITAIVQDMPSNLEGWRNVFVDLKKITLVEK